MDEKNYKSIGEVLGLLLDEFPDVTISKDSVSRKPGLDRAGADTIGISQVQ